jgi:hypothetical protein
MTSPKFSILSKETLMPLGLVVTIVGGVWMAAQTDKQVSINTEDIAKIQTSIQGLPTRSEFNTMKEDVKEIKLSLREINAYLTSK